MASDDTGRQSQEPLKQRIRGIRYRKGVRQQHPTISSLLCHFTMVRPIFPYPGFQTHHYFSSPGLPHSFPQLTLLNTESTFMSDQLGAPLLTTQLPPYAWNHSSCSPAPRVASVSLATTCFQLPVQNSQCCSFSRQSIFWYSDTVWFQFQSSLQELYLSPRFPEILRSVLLNTSSIPGSLSPRTDSLYPILAS